jgi:hypothetical protein
LSVNRVRHRVGIDLDNDGYISWGVDPSAIAYDNQLLGAPDFLGMVGQRYAGASPVAGATQQRTTQGNTVFPDFTGFWSTKAATVNSGDQLHIGRAKANPTTQIANQFFIQSADALTLHFQCWVRCSSGALASDYSLTMQRHSVRDMSGSSTTSGVTTVALPANTWVNLRGSFTNIAARRWFNLVFGFGATLTNFEVVGVRLNFNAQNFYFVPSVGTAGGAGYEDVTDRVARLEYMTGTEDSFDRMPADSTCTIVLNDPDDIYNPTRETAPGLQLRRNRVVVQRSPQNAAGQWITAWQGYITNVVPISGEPRNHQVEITATKTLFEVTNDEVVLTKFHDTPYEAIEFSDALNDLFKRNAVSGFSASPSWRLGVSKLDESTVVVDGDDGIVIDANTADVRGWGYLSKGRSFLETLQGMLDMSPTTRFKQFPQGIVQITKPVLALPSGHTGLTFPDDYVLLDDFATEILFEYGKHVYTQITAMHQEIVRGDALLLPELREPSADVDDDSADYTDRYWGTKNNIGIGERKRFRKSLKTVAVIDPAVPSTNYPEWGLGNPPTGSTSYDYDVEKVFIEQIYDPGFDANDPDKHTHSIAYDATTPAGLTPGTRMTGAVWEANFRDPDSTLLRVRFSNDGSHPATWSVDLQTVKAKVNVITDPILVSDNRNIDQLPNLSTYHMPHLPASFDDVGLILSGWLDLYSLPQPMISSFSFTINDVVDEDSSQWLLFAAGDPGEVLYLHSNRAFKNAANLSPFVKQHSLGHVITGKRVSVSGSEIKVTIYTTSNNSSGFEL